MFYLTDRVYFRGFSPAIASQGMTNPVRLAVAKRQSQELLAYYARMGTSMVPEGMTYAELAQVMLSEEEAKEVLPGRLKRFFTHLLDANRDGRVNETEWTRFFYGVAQWIEEKNPFVAKTGHESAAAAAPKVLSLDWSLYLGRALSDCDYLVEEAKRGGLKPKEIAALEARLTSCQIGGTGQSLATSFDVAKRQHGMEPFIAKMVKVVQNYDQLVRLPWSLALGEADLKRFKAFLLRQLAMVGNMPAATGQSDESNLELQQYDANPLPRKYKRVERYELKHRKISIKQMPDTGTSARLKVCAGPFKRLTVLSAIHPDHYHLSPQMVQTNGIPAAQALNQTLGHLKDLLVKTVLAHPAEWRALQQTVLASPIVFERLQQDLTALFVPLKSALGLEPLAFSVTPFMADETGTHLVDGAGYFNPASKPVSIVLNAEAMGLRMAQIVANPKNNAPSQCISDILLVLLEELVHAHQHQATRHLEGPAVVPYPPERLKDYEEALRFHRLYLGMDKTVLGDKRYYTEQPMERDAKWVVQAALKDIMPALTPLLPGPGPQEPAPQKP